MVNSQGNVGSSSGPSSSRPRSETPVGVQPPPPRSPESTSASVNRERLRALVPDPNNSIAVSKRIIDVLRDVQNSSRADEQANGIHLTITSDQFNDLLILSHQNLRNVANSNLAGIESQLSELSSRVSDVHYALRGSSRYHPPPWSRLDPVPPGYAADTPPPTGYGGPGGRERGPPQPLGYVGPDGRVYGLMEDQRRWPPAASSYSGGNPTWPRGGEYGDHARPPPASVPGELQSWHPIGRRLSRAEDGVGAPSQPLSQPRERERDRERDYPLSASEHGLHVSTNASSSRPESGSSASYDRPTNGQMSPVASSSAPSTHRPGLEKMGRPNIVAPLSSGSAPSTSTALTDPTSKAPSISFLVNPSYEHAPRARQDSRSPPPGLPHPLSRYDGRHPPHHGHHPSMELDGHMHVRSHHHHGHHPYGHRSVESLDGNMSFTSSMGGGKMPKTSAPSSSRSDVLLGGSGKRRIRNGACTFCREKKLACRPGPMADDPTATGPATCDQCYRRQRTCQHDPEHRRRRRQPIPPKKPSGTSDDGGPSRSVGGELPHYGHHSSTGPSGYGPMSAGYDYEGEDGDNRMESEDPLLPSAAGAASNSPEVSTVSVSFGAREREEDNDRERTLTHPTEPVKDEEVDQLDTEWMQPD